MTASLLILLICYFTVRLQAVDEFFFNSLNIIAWVHRSGPSFSLSFPFSLISLSPLDFALFPYSFLYLSLLLNLQSSSSSLPHLKKLFVVSCCLQTEVREKLFAGFCIGVALVVFREIHLSANLLITFPAFMNLSTQSQ
jgi:hypothetical protein